MQTVSYHVATSVDGFIAEADGSFDRFLLAGEHVKDYLAALQEYGSVIMGRRTYQVALDMGVMDPYPHLDTYVFSRSMGESPHPHVRLVTGDLAQFVATLRSQDGKGIYLSGGGHVAAQLLREQLIDELVVKINPIVFGTGIRLFEGEAAFARLVHIATKVFVNGVVVCTYRFNHVAP